MSGDYDYLPVEVSNIASLLLEQLFNESLIHSLIMLSGLGTDSGVLAP